MIKKTITTLLLLMPFFPLLANENIVKRLSGRILLQVESHGEAWFVSPVDNKKYSLGRPNEAFELMRKFGVGITDNDLSKIAIGVIRGSTSSEPLDSDGDGYSDLIEIENNYNPYGPGKQNIDLNFTEKHLGKIFIQTEKRGEAWYVSPTDKKRYFLGRPQNAFDIMRNLGLGITNDNLNQIPTGIIYSEATVALEQAQEQKVISQNTDTIDLVAQAIRSGNKTEAIKYFIPEMSKAIEYTIDFLNSEGRLTLGNILSGSRLTESTEDNKTYTNEVYFNGEMIPVRFNLEKRDGVWLMINL